MCVCVRMCVCVCVCVCVFVCVCVHACVSGGGGGFFFFFFWEVLCVCAPPPTTHPPHLHPQVGGSSQTRTVQCDLISTSFSTARSYTSVGNPVSYFIILFLSSYDQHYKSVDHHNAIPSELHISSHTFALLLIWEDKSWVWEYPIVMTV